MKQWMRRFFAVLMMACLMLGNAAWARRKIPSSGLSLMVRMIFPVCT